MRKHITEEEDILNEIITERVNIEANSISKLEQLLASDKQGSFFTDISKHGISSPDIMNFYMIALTHQLLDITERFKKYLLITLDKEAIGLKDNPTLGNIFAKLKEKKINHKFDEIMDNQMRNALGHGSYYWKNGEFCYTVDSQYKRTRVLTLGELFVIIRKIVLVGNAFNSIAFDKILEIKRSHVPNENT